jgi:glycosyltransferase involved in cell wall biosynthesis
MRLLVASTTFDRSEQAIFSALPAAGIDTEFAGLPAAGKSKDLLRAGVAAHTWIVRHRLDLRAVVRLRELLAVRRPDAIYAPNNRALSVSLLATRRTRIPVVAYRGTIGHISRWDPASWLTYLHPRLARIVCVSAAVRDYLLSMGLPENRLTTIYKGHDPAWYAGPKPSLAPFGFGAGAFVVGFTGNMRPVKGIDVLMDAARGLPDSSRIRLLLVGEVREAAIRRAAEAPALRARVCLAGFRADAAALAGACDAYVMPSVEREGLPRGVIEAMCQGVCPVVSDVGGMPELVEHGRSGLVVPPRDPGALREALLQLEHDRAACLALGAGARRRIEETFHIRATIPRMVALFRAVADGRSPNP